MKPLRLERSEKLFAQAKVRLPGGVNSPVRAYGAVGGTPFFASRGAGAFIYDVDGNRYLDYVGSYGPLILGHAPPEVVARVQEAAAQGTSFGAPTAREVQLAQLVHAAVPSCQQMRFTSSGTEATMSAVRLCRGATGRDKIIKFSGGYHGHADPFLTDAGSGIATLGIPGSAGVPTGTAADVLTVPYNDLSAVQACFEAHRHLPEAATHAAGIAAVIVEPVACNMGMVQPTAGFLQGLRRLCDAHGALLIFDEVITGFRVAFGGAQAHFGVTPDVSTFGKIIGGGLPVGAYGGRSDLMALIAPCGPVYQAGTLSGNPLAMAAGIATLERLGQGDVYPLLESRGAAFQKSLDEVLQRHGKPFSCDRIGSLFYFYFNRGAALPRNYHDIKQADGAAYAKFFHHMLHKGVSMAPSPFEVGFFSVAHTADDLQATVERIDQVLRDTPL